jgi:hypothetical protein
MPFAPYIPFENPPKSFFRKWDLMADQQSKVLTTDGIPLKLRLPDDPAVSYYQQ